MHFKKAAAFITLLAMAALLLFCASTPEGVAITHKGIQIRYDNLLHSEVTALSGVSTVVGGISASEYPVIDGVAVTDFEFKTHNIEGVRDALGQGKKHILVGQAPGLEKKLTVTLYDDFPAAAVVQVTYTNTGAKTVQLDSWTNHHYAIKTGPAVSGQAAFWSYEPATYESRPDWFLPVKPGFNQENFLGMNASDYGGGTPTSGGRTSASASATSNWCPNWSPCRCGWPTAWPPS